MTICAGKVVYSRVPERITSMSAPAENTAPVGAEGGHQRARWGRSIHEAGPISP